jgi:hypothetical protein
MAEDDYMPPNVPQLRRMGPEDYAPFPEEDFRPIERNLELQEEDMMDVDIETQGGRRKRRRTRHHKRSRKSRKNRHTRRRRHRRSYRKV